MQSQLAGRKEITGLEQRRVHQYPQAAKIPAAGRREECGLEDPAVAPLHKLKRIANVCKVCWESAVPYAMGHVQETNSVVMKREDQGKTPVFMGLGYQRSRQGLGKDSGLQAWSIGRGGVFSQKPVIRTGTKIRKGDKTESEC